MRLFDTGDGKLSRGSRQVEADRESSFGPCLAQELEVSGVCLGRGVAHEGQFTTRDAACVAGIKALKYRWRAGVSAGASGRRVTMAYCP